MQAIHRATWPIAVVVTAGLLGAASIATAQAIGSPPPGSLHDASDNRRPHARGLRPPKVTVSPQAHARAAELTSQAQAQYDSGRYEEASESYRQAYAVVPAPELLFNLGQCQRLLGRSERALKYFEANLRLRRRLVLRRIGTASRSARDCRNRRVETPLQCFGNRSAEIELGRERFVDGSSAT